MKKIKIIKKLNLNRKTITSLYAVKAGRQKAVILSFECYTQNPDVCNETNTCGNTEENCLRTFNVFCQD